jgi:CRP/FNR family cyclic AMP-dependent transcriptional regulator
MPQSLSDMAMREARARVARRPQPEQAPRRTRRESAAVLGTIPLFSGFSKRHLQHLAKEADELDYVAGGRIVEAGMPGEALYVVLAGHARIVRGTRKIGDLVPGEFFGELSALDGGPRSASVVAQTPVRVLRLFRHTLFELLRAEPRLALRLLDEMVRRVRETERRASAV